LGARNSANPIVYVVGGQTLMALSVRPATALFIRASGVAPAGEPPGTEPGPIIVV
jgi:hypothetical protein